MAEPVIVPVRLEVTDIDMSNLNLADVEKDISAKMSGIKKSIQDGFKGIDASAINKPIEKSMTAVSKSLQAAEDAQLRFNEAMVRAGKSTQAYKDSIGAIDDEIAIITKTMEQWSTKEGDIPNQVRKAFQPQLDALYEKRNKINPVDFVDKAAPIELEKVANAYKKVLSAMENVNKQSDKFNQTIQDNRATDEYNELIKQVEKYKKEIEGLDEKSKYFAKYGATDNQWEKLRNDTDWASSKMDELIAKMREAVKTGKAFRFGDGDRGEMSRQINSYAMSSGNRVGNIQSRANIHHNPYTVEYQLALNELDKLEKKVERVREKSIKMIDVGASKKQLQNLSSEIRFLDVRIDEVKNNLMGMANSGQAFKFGDGNVVAEVDKIRSSADSMQSTLSGVSQTVDLAQGGLSALAVVFPKLAPFIPVINKIIDGFQTVGKVASVAGKGIAKGFEVAVKVLSTVANTVKKISSGFINLGKRIFSSIKSMNLFGKSGHSTTSSLGDGFKKLFKNFLTFGLGFRTLYYLIKRLRTILIEGLQNIGDKFDEVGQPMMRFMEAFNRLKGSLATAFQPLASVLMPILTKFMNQLSDMLVGVAKFSAILTGQSHIYKAVAKNISSVASAAKNANKQLGSYDKLEVIKQNDTGYDYEKESIFGTDAAASDLATMIKKAWETSDFTEVGKVVTQKLLAVLDRVETEIVPKVTGLVNKVLLSVNTFLTGFDSTAIGSKISSIFNALVTQVNWVQLGALFANLYNTIWGFFDGIVNGIKWDTLGDSVGDGVNSFVDILDLERLVGIISGLFDGIITAVFKLITKIDWSKASKKIGDSINKLFADIDTQKLWTTIQALFTNLFGFIVTFFTTVDYTPIMTALTTGINTLFGGREMSGGFVTGVQTISNWFAGLLNAAITGIDWSGVLSTLVMHLSSVLYGVSSALESTDNPILSAIGTVVDALRTIVISIGPIINSVMPVLLALLQPIADIIAWFVDVTMPVLEDSFAELMPILTQLVEIIFPLIMDLLESSRPILDAITNAILPVTVQFLKACMPLVDGLLQLVTDILAPIASVLGIIAEIITNCLKLVVDILAPILDLLGFLCAIVGDVLRPILDVLTPVLETVNRLVIMIGSVTGILGEVLQFVANIIKIIVGALASIVIPIIEAVIGVIEFLVNIVMIVIDAFTLLFSCIKTIFTSLANSVKEPGNKFIAIIEKIANVVISAVNAIIKSLNKLSFNVPDWIPGLGGKAFGFNIKELREVKIPRLAQGAVIPPNKEFLAVLGDQKHGTNIEAPLDTIKQALAEVLAEVGGGNREPIILQVNGRTLAKVVWDEQEKRYKQTGKYSMA